MGNEWDLHIYGARFSHALTERPETAALSMMTHQRRGGGVEGGDMSPRNMKADSWGINIDLMDDCGLLQITVGVRADYR